MKLRVGGWLVIVILLAFLLPMPAPGGQATLGWQAVAAQGEYDCASQSEVPLAECAVLVTFYNSTNGAAWTDNTGWLATTSPCTWFGIICASDHIVSIALPQNGLVGTLPTELGTLTTLVNLSLYTNQLSGTIPTSLGNLTLLENLNLSGNQLTGSIPTGFGNFSNLTDLWLNDNQLSGAIPTELGNLGSLQNLILYTNQLSGSIPTQLGNLSNLSVLYLAGNQLTGSIPSGLGGLSQLTEVYLNNNQLSGGIPAELGNLSNLTALQLSTNQLTGSIPAQLGNLSNLTDLWLQQNNLTGALPAALGNLGSLKVLILYSNQLSGAIPTELGNLSQLESLYLNSNGFTGTIPTQLGNLSQLTTLHLSNNNLTGPIPSALGNLTNLTTLYLSANQLSGTIPTQFGNLASLTELYLHQNLLTGSLPTELGNLSNLKNFFAYSNQLSGAIPTQLSNLSQLELLYLNDNNFTGTIPTALGNLSQLKELYLSDNALTGNIPPELGNLTNLTTLYLSANQLSGTIPTQLGNLSNLTGLFLHQNLLTGPIPAELGNLTNLINLFVYTNQLSGNIPAQLGNLSSASYLYLSDNALDGTIPDALGNLANLQILYLNDNNLIGQLPATLGNLAQLNSLDISSNLLSGALPATMSNLTLLESFSFFATGLCIPDNNPTLSAWLAGIDTANGSDLTCEQIPASSLVIVPNAARAGAQVRVVGDRYQPQGPYSFYLSGLGTPVGATVADGAGQFDVVITIPGDYTPPQGGVSVIVGADFAPTGPVQSVPVSWLQPLGLSLNPVSARPGETVTATVANLFAGTLDLGIGDITVAGPVEVAAGGVVLSFVVPTTGAGAVTVEAQNLVNALPFGTATAALTVLSPSTFDFTEQPNASVEVVDESPPPPWEGDATIVLAGSFPDIPADLRSDVNVDVMFASQNGRVFPLNTQPLSLDANANFNAEISLPSLFAGDPVPASASGNFVITARMGDVAKVIQADLPVQTAEPPFGIRVVRKGTDVDIPDTPGGSLRLLYRPQGIAYADSADLDSATFSDALGLAFRTVYADQIHDAVANVVEKYFDCHPLIPQQEVQPWETVWRPPDEYKLLGDQQIAPVVQIPNLVKQLNIARASAAGVQPNAVAGADAQLEVRFIHVTVDATEIKDGTIAPNGYGPPEWINEKRKVAYGGLYAVVPATGAVFLVAGFDSNNLLKQVEFVRLPAGPVIIALQPYPAGTLKRLQFDVSVPDVNVTDITYINDPAGFGTVPVRAFGQIYSFKDYPVPMSFAADDLKIHAIVNDGYAGVQIPLNAIKMTLLPANGGPAISLPVKQENYGSDPCKSVPRVRFVGTLADGGRALPPGRHAVVVEIKDGIDTLSQRIVLGYVSPPAYFAGAGLKNRRVVWSPAKTELSATRFDSADDTKVPGDLKVQPPKGPQPNPMHVDNESGLDNRILQTLTPSGFGQVVQTNVSRAKSWNTALSPGAASAQQTAFPSLAAFSAAAARPVIPCDPNSPYEYCIGPKSFAVPEKEILLFPPILWGLPGLADIKIAGTLAYLAGVDISGVARAATPPELTMQVWPYAQVRVAIDIAAELLGGLIGRLGLNTSANVHADVPVVFSPAGKSDANACFRWFVVVRIYVQAGCIPFTDACAYEDEIDKRTILDGREPNSDFCNAQVSNQVSAAASPLDDLPPSGNPAIASDGIHMLAIWNTTTNELVYSHFNGNSWSAPLAIDTGRIAERAAVAYFDANRAVAVWNGSTVSQPGGQTLDSVVAAQVLEYSVWDGTAWSEPARLAAQSSGDGGAVLASCPAGAAGCPVGGAVTAAWTHLADGVFSNLKLRVYTATFTNGSWSAPQAVDPSSTSLDTAPMVTYAAGQAVVGWVRDADSSFATTEDRRIALRTLASPTVELPQALPTGVVAGSLAADAQGQLIVVYTRAADGALIANHHEIVAALQSCQAGCTWTAKTLVDTNGRVLQGEHPVLTVDSLNRATITYRATGFGPDTEGNMVYASDAPGITLGSGELAQLEINSQLVPANPRSLTQEGVLNWEPAAAYNAGTNQIVALSVRGPAIGLAASVASVNASASVQALDDTLIFVNSDRQPDFALESIAPIYPSPTATLPSSLVVTITNQGVAPTGNNLQLEVAVAWDTSPLAAVQVYKTSIAALGSGAAATLTLPLPAVSGAPEAGHVLYVTINGNRAIAEADLANNALQLNVVGVPAPEQVYVTADPVNALFHLRWDAPERSEAIAGYRIYRRTGAAAWQPVGSSFGTAWAEVNATFGTTYEYAVSAYAASGFESTLSQSMMATMSAVPLAEDTIIFLPKLFKTD